MCRMPAVIDPLAITDFTLVSALGAGREAHLQALSAERGGLAVNDFSNAPLPCHVGRVAGPEDMTVPPALMRWDCRNNRLAWMGLNQDGLLDAVNRAAQRFGRARVAVLLGTSTGSIGFTEDAYRHLDDDRLPVGSRWPPVHSLHSLGGFVAAVCDLHGPCMTVSTACSSSAKVFAAAERMIRLGLVDAALVGGVDTLCDSVLFGFHALQLVSSEQCRPFDVARCGISIGEAAAFALLERADRVPQAPQLIGYGEASDAYHMSTPHPQGIGAELALDSALARAGLDAAQVDYVNLHGTATPKNDEVEAALVARRFPTSTRCSSTKGYTGHTLGAAGAVEAAISLLAIEHDMVPGNLGCRMPDSSCAGHLALHRESRPVRVALSNSFGFGGNNACLAFARAGGSA